MADYGILIDANNTGLDSELCVSFAAPLSVISNRPVSGSDAASLKRVVVSQNVQRWEIEANLVPTNNSVEYASHAFVNGASNVVYVRMPQIFVMGRTFNNLSLATTNNRTRGDVNAQVTGTGFVNLGEFFTFGGHPKVYYCTAFSGSIISFFPPLVSDIPSGSDIIHGQKCTMQAYHDPTTANKIVFSDGILLDPGSIKLIEAI